MYGGRFSKYDGVSDVNGEFSLEFRRYIQDEKLICNYTTHINDFQCWLFEKHGVDYDYLDPLIKVVKLAANHARYDLVQFWKAEELTAVGEKRFILTTRNQPFLISKPCLEALADHEICTYRMKMVDIVTRDAGDGGVVGRVFWNKRMEATPNVGYYSYEEYPHRDLALSCNIKGSLALPLTDSSGCLRGVLEIVSLFDLGFCFDASLISKLQQWSGLNYFDCSKDIRQQYDLKDESLHIAIFEIEEVMEVVGRSADLVCSQTWMLSDNCKYLCISKRIACGTDAYYGGDFQTTSFIELECAFTLKKEEGVVGKAASSVHNLVYCEDVSQFCITEYPLAHFARECELTSNFAICLRSDLTGSQIYILEFFLNTNEFNRRDLRAILVPILERMRQNFRTFKVASGEEIGDNLFVLVIDAQSPDKIATLKHRELELRLTIGINNIEGCLPYNVPYSIGESSTHETDDPMDGAESSFNESSTKDTTLVSASTVQSELRVTVNASFRGDFFIFQLSSSLGINGLSQQVSRQLNLENGSYIVKYLDEDNDWILVACDDDLHLYISSLTKQGKYTLTIKIEPIEEF